MAQVHGTSHPVRYLNPNATSPLTPLWSSSLPHPSPPPRHSDPHGQNSLISARIRWYRYRLEFTVPMESGKRFGPEISTIDTKEVVRRKLTLCVATQYSLCSFVQHTARAKTALVMLIRDKDISAPCITGCQTERRLHHHTSTPITLEPAPKHANQPFCLRI